MYSLHRQPSKYYIQRSGSVSSNTKIDSQTNSCSSYSHSNQPYYQIHNYSHPYGQEVKNVGSLYSSSDTNLTQNLKAYPQKEIVCKNSDNHLQPAPTLREQNNIKNLLNNLQGHQNNKTSQILEQVLHKISDEMQQKYKGIIESASLEMDRLTSMLQKSRDENKVLNQIIDRLRNQTIDNQQISQKYKQLLEENQSLKTKISDKENVIKVLATNTGPVNSPSNNTHSPSKQKGSSPSKNRGMITSEREIQLLDLIKNEKKINAEKDKKINELILKINSIENYIDELAGNNSNIIHQVAEIFETSQSNIHSNLETEEPYLTTPTINLPSSSLPIDSAKKQRRTFATEIHDPSFFKQNDYDDGIEHLRQLKNKYIDHHKAKTEYICTHIEALQDKIGIMMGIYSKICKEVFEEFQSKGSQ